MHFLGYMSGSLPSVRSNQKHSVRDRLCFTLSPTSMEDKLLLQIKFVGRQVLLRSYSSQSSVSVKQ